MTAYYVAYSWNQGLREWIGECQLCRGDHGWLMAMRKKKMKV